MARTAAPQAPGSFQFLGTEDAVSSLEDGESLGSSDDDEANQLPFPDAESQPASDEASGQLYDNNRKLQEMQQRLAQKKKRFQALLKAYQRKEMEFVAQMDSHMDEVEHTEHALSLKIEATSAENHQLRTFNEKRERDNSQLAERLSETTKQCSESETRVQFLVDRIVALLSSGSGDPSQTEAVVSMRQRERDMLRQLEETRQQFDEVRQQNGELHSRLTEELGLSRRLQDQLVEVEERFSLFQTQRGTDHGGFPGVESSLQPGLQGSGFPGLEATPGLRAGRLGPRPMGLRSDQSEAPPERERQPLPELPPPISEVGEGNEPSQMDGQSTALNPVMEGELAQFSDEEQAAEQESCGDAADSGDNAEYAASLPEDPPPLSAATGGMPVDNSDDLVSMEESTVTRLNQGNRPSPTMFPSSSRASPRPGPAAKPPANERPQYSRTTSSEGVALMEQKLREALDRASFECAVVRNENGTYNFGPSVCAVVELTPENEVVACLQDSGDWAAIDEFIRRIAARPALLQNQGASSSGNVAPPPAFAPVVANKASPVDTAGGEAPSERRLFGPPAKAAAPYGGGGALSSLASGTPLAASGGSSAVSSMSPRRLAPSSILQSGGQAPLTSAKSAPLAAAKTLQSGGSSAPLVQSGSSSSPVVQAAGALGRQSAGSTPERVRMPMQPSPRPGYPGGQVLSSAANHQAQGPQSGGQRMLIAPNAGAASRYGVATLSPGRQMPSAGGMYQQGSSSPRLQG